MTEVAEQGVTEVAEQGMTEVAEHGVTEEDIDEMKQEADLMTYVVHFFIGVSEMISDDIHK